MNDPRHIHAHARNMMIEQIMALHGRAATDPLRYRRMLESFDTATLSRTLESFHESPSHEFFPAPSLTENAGVIASTDTGHAPGTAREILTLQSSLP